MEIAASGEKKVWKGSGTGGLRYLRNLVPSLHTLGVRGGKMSKEKVIHGGSRKAVKARAGWTQ